MWRVGNLTGLLQHFGDKKKDHFEYSAIYKLPKFENVSSEEIKEYAVSILKFGRTDLLDDFVESLDNLEVANA